MPRANLDERASRGSPKRDKILLDEVREVLRYHEGRKEHFTVLKDEHRRQMYETSALAVAEVLHRLELKMKRTGR